MTPEIADSSSIDAESRLATPQGAPPTILVLAPDTTAISGVSTHVAQLFESSLARSYRLVHFQTGSEGRSVEARTAKLRRAVTSPVVLARQIARERPRIVYINSALEPKAFWRDAVYVVTSRVLRRPTVFEVHGGHPPATFGGSRVLRRLVHAILRLPQRLVLLSAQEKSDYAAYDADLPTVVIANAVDLPEAYRPPLKPVNDTDPLRLVFLGRIVAAKGVFESVDAVRLLRDRGITVELTIAGAGPDLGRVEAAIEAADVGDRVHIVGPKQGTEKNELLAESDVLVFPTYHREGLPYALLEAMAYGAVPVTCPVGGIVDVLEGADEPCGVLVPPKSPAALAQAIETLHTDRSATRAMSAAGHARVVQHYTVQRMTDEFESLFGGM